MGIAADVGLLVIHLYFFTVHVVFVVINLFIKKEHVPASVDPLVMLSATEAVRKIRRREIRPSQLVEAYIHRIEQVNSMINAAVVTMFDEARTIAKEYDRQLQELPDERLDDLFQRRPLFGVPFSCKDSLSVEGQIVTCGSYYRRNHRCENTALAVQRVREAGGILIAITNVPEWCCWIESDNCVYGRSNNPYDTRRIVGGSSGGEGALISAAGTPIGVGSDLGGSVRIPSFCNGIFGLMPTPGMVPLDNYIPVPVGYKKQVLRIGPMCRYVEDMPLLFKVMAADKSIELKLDEPIDFRRCRVFYMLGVRHPLIEPLSATMRETLEKAVSHFEKTFNLEGVGLDLPLTLHHPEFYSASMAGNLELSKKLLSLEGNAGRVSFWKELPKWISGKSHHKAPALMQVGLESLVQSTEESRAESTRIRDRLKRQIVETLGNKGLLFFPSVLFLQLVARNCPYFDFSFFGPGKNREHGCYYYPHTIYQQSGKNRSQIKEVLEREQKNDSPAIMKLNEEEWPTTTPFHNEPLFAILNTAYTALFNALALPAIQCPMGLDTNGLPLGVQVVASPGCERLLLAAAREINTAFGGWKPAWEK